MNIVGSMFRFQYCSKYWVFPHTFLVPLSSLFLSTSMSISCSTFKFVLFTIPMGALLPFHVDIIVFSQRTSCWECFLAPVNNSTLNRQEKCSKGTPPQCREVLTCKITSQNRRFFRIKLSDSWNDDFNESSTKRNWGIVYVPGIMSRRTGRGKSISSASLADSESCSYVEVHAVTVDDSSF